ncbi:tetratricopeptide repeat protein [Mucilaginibacter aquariorum]|uniref:Tetratricopeptide repeat protein n=1 Tax=Mucilaginibacter aquariorum TaxID=2967225 RepID=A0ABT1T5C1_9SPHI|nr:tetratricopeptide repeat protein [Mucilaginibacter aquariorum]MCQ6959805.1 tetratricopeptide repeat protein [Mucilaginibacter aquariorum]
MTQRLIAILITVGLLYSAVSSFAANNPLNSSYTNAFANWGSALKKQLNGKSAEFNEGVLKIEQNQLGEGLSLINKSLVNALATGRVSSNLAYSFYEFINLLKISEAIKSTDKNLANAFIYASFADKADKDSVFNVFFNKKAANEYSGRMKLLAFTGVNDPNLTAELREFLIRYPAHFSANLLNADKYFFEKKWKEASEAYTKCISISPQYAYAYRMRGSCNSLIGEKQKSVDDFDKALKLQPTYYEALYGRASQYQDLDKYSDAISDYLKCYKKKKNYFLLTYNLSRCYKELKMMDSAMIYADEYIAMNPDAPLGYYGKGNIYFDKEKYLKAADLFSRCIALKPQEPRYCVSRGESYYFADSASLAIKDFKKAFELGDSTAYVSRLIGECLYKQKQYDAAIPYYKQSIKISPDNELTWESLNLTYVKLKRYPEAIEAGLRSIKIDFTYSSAMTNLGWAYYCSGNYDKCIFYSYKSLKLSKSAVPMFNIALATLRKGQFSDAKKLYSEFVSDCNTNKIKINDGAITDLKDLIDQKVMVTESKFIIKNIFGEK